MLSTGTPYFEIFENNYEKHDNDCQAIFPAGAGDEQPHAHVFFAGIEQGDLAAQGILAYVQKGAEGEILAEYCKKEQGIRRGGEEKRQDGPFIRALDEGDEKDGGNQQGHIWDEPVGHCAMDSPVEVFAFHHVRDYRSSTGYHCTKGVAGYCVGERSCQCDVV